MIPHIIQLQCQPEILLGIRVTQSAKKSGFIAAVQIESGSD